MAPVVIDASVVIAFVDAGDRHHARAVSALAASHVDELVLPASAYAEILGDPYRHGPESVATAERLVSDIPFRVAPITREIARAAAQLRAQRQSLRLPDAFVLATGNVLDAAPVLTADRAWLRVSPRARMI
jgi:predicted nucleic acid-binding protein